METLLQVGMKVTASPQGPGEITSITDRGMPRVGEVAVAWVRLENGSVYDPFFVADEYLKGEKNNG